MTDTTPAPATISPDGLKTESATLIIWMAVMELDSAISHASRYARTDQGRDDRDRDVLRYINKAHGLLSAINTRAVGVLPEDGSQRGVAAAKAQAEMDNTRA